IRVCDDAFSSRTEGWGWGRVPRSQLRTRALLRFSTIVEPPRDASEEPLRGRSASSACAANDLPRAAAGHTVFTAWRTLAAPGCATVGGTGAPTVSARAAARFRSE